MTPFQRRLLAYIQQHPQADRVAIVCDLAAPSTRLGQGHVNGTNGGAPRIVGAWMKPLIERGFAERRYTKDGYFLEYRLTEAGRRALTSTGGGNG